MRRPIISVSEHAACIALVVITVGSSMAAQRHPAANGPTCESAGPLTRVPELPEGSGVAASRLSPGRLWAHNDSGEPVLFALDSDGAVIGRVRVTGATVDDWEALAVGPCPAGSCILIADIGDNDAERRHVTVYRVPEPSILSGSVAVTDVFHLSYPDGAHDAETFLVTPNGDIVIVTKGDTGPVARYRASLAAPRGGRVALQRIGEPRQPGKALADGRITDGAVSPSGAWLALRTNTSVHFYRTHEFMAGDWREAGRVSLKDLGEPQGEGLAFGDDATMYLVGEGGRKSQPGSFGRLTCAF